MNEIRTTKIDWVEFVTLTDYLRLKEEKQELEYLWDINEELKEENKKLKSRIAGLEKCNLNLQEYIDKQEVRIKELETTNKKRTADNWATFKS